MQYNFPCTDIENTLLLVTSGAKKMKTLRNDNKLVILLECKNERSPNYETHPHSETDCCNSCNIYHSYIRQAYGNCYFKMDPEEEVRMVEVT